MATACGQAGWTGSDDGESSRPYSAPGDLGLEMFSTPPGPTVVGHSERLSEKNPARQQKIISAGRRTPGQDTLPCHKSSPKKISAASGPGYILLDDFHPPDHIVEVRGQNPQKLAVASKRSSPPASHLG